MGSSNSFSSYNHLKVNLGVFLTGYTVAMAACYVKETCPSMLRLFLGGGGGLK